jgi:non-heme chloroperoxidase
MKTAAPKVKPARAEYIKVEPNVRLHVTDVGEGRPIVLLHGWPLSDDMFEYQYHKLIAKNFRVIGITLRGFGLSDKPFGSHGYDVHALDVKHVLQALGIDDAVLCGFSMGGAVAVRYMALYKGEGIKKLVLAAAAVPLFTQRKNFPFNLKRSKVDDLIDQCHEDRTVLLTNFSKIFSATQKALSQEIRDWLYGIGLSASPHATVECLIALRDTDLRKDMAAIKVPTLILHGRKDKICSFALAEQMLAGIEGSKLIAFEKSGHSLFLEETDKFNAALVAFCKKG